MNDFSIVAEVETKNGLIQVRKIDSLTYHVGILSGDNFEIKHLDVGADGAIRAIANYLQNANYLLEKSSTVVWRRTFNEPEDYGDYLVKIKGQEDKPIIAYFGHPNGERHTGWYGSTDGEFYEVDAFYWSVIPT